MKKTVINWGVIGTGIISTSFAKDCAFVPNAKLHSVISRKKENAHSFAAQYGISHVHTDLDQMLRDPELDAVYIGTPHPHHFGAARAAMKAGKAVLCEKPLTVTAEETSKLIAIQKETGVYLMEAMWTYFLPAIQKAKEWVDSGRIGDVVAIKGDFGYPQIYDPKSRTYNPDLAGGALLDMGIYPVAFAYLFSGGRTPKRLMTSARFAPNGIDDDITTIFEYDQKMTATLGTSFRARLKNMGVIIGTKGHIEIPDFFRASQCAYYELDDCLETFCDHRKSIGLSFETEAMCQDLLKGRLESRVVPLKASQAFADHMEMIRKSW
ncbi:Gfo/Idh/MocA family oxidoreductase [Temperatibacter marinus]|uniref:Gfo/Idh/MocA family oxidoreductase n=1 Tax=Temperatibacter marinus TaxID=1456591 RepID=A0AA52EF38_9PROT|nr:Gfo/Idh/MocA family oxidoreductase [Temperatibacter marinus]WND03570.1 Gfo/Idh/MocA family oxidoreductase [Temperatibacter marinus]